MNGTAPTNTSGGGTHEFPCLMRIYLRDRPDELPARVERFDSVPNRICIGNFHPRIVVYHRNRLGQYIITEIEEYNGILTTGKCNVCRIKTLHIVFVEFLNPTFCVCYQRIHYGLVPFGHKFDLNWNEFPGSLEEILDVEIPTDTCIFQNGHDLAIDIIPVTDCPHQRTRL